MARLKSRHKETPFFRSLLGLIPFPKLQNSCSALSFPGVRGGGSKLPHSCGLVASKEDAGLRAALLKACGRRSKLRHCKDLPRQTSSTKTKSRILTGRPTGFCGGLIGLGKVEI